MIVMIEMINGENKKTLVRNGIFHEINQINKKTESITSSKIANVYWPTKTGMQKVPVKKWVDYMDQNNYFGLVE